jgi:hypothetical protein
MTKPKFCHASEKARALGDDFTWTPASRRDPPAGDQPPRLNIPAALALYGPGILRLSGLEALVVM